jgi:predicted enzyme related to lactoylglutathione lyase
MIGMHAIIYSTAAEKDRKFFKDVLGLSSVDAGDGWLIFALPPAEIAVHPDKRGGFAALYFMCKDIRTTLAELRRMHMKVVRDVSDQGCGLLAYVALPSGAELGICEPRHATAISKRRE